MWREGGKQVDLARFLPGMEVDLLDDGAAKKAGELLRAGGTSDLVDAHVALLAGLDDRVLTGDVADIKADGSDAEPGDRALLWIRRVKATVIRI